MSTIQAILFGIVEGLTEFIPVSSTAHMLLLQRALGLTATPALFAFLVLIQLGAIAALLIYFHSEFWSLIRGFFARPFSNDGNRMAWLILIATIPALVAGALLRDVVGALFRTPLLEAGIRLITAALLLFLAELLGRANRALAGLGWLDSLIIGLFQVLSVFPGASRSGTAIAGGMLRNLDRASATRFAFLLSAPVMIAAGAYETLGVVRDGLLVGMLPALAVGLPVSAAVGWISIRWLVNYVGSHRLYSFAAYCAAGGLICLFIQFH